MNPHRKGNAFPQPGVPGDPRLLDQLHSQQVRGPNMQITHTQSGVLISPPKSKIITAVATGPFCKKYLSGGFYYLLGGQVTGGAGNVAVPDIELAEGGSEPADGTHHWLVVAFTAYVEDDVLLPGGDVTAVTEGSGSTIPDNIIPTAIDPEGTLHVSLGSWSQGKFEVAGCGNIQIGHCLGSLTYSRA